MKLSKKDQQSVMTTHGDTESHLNYEDIDHSTKASAFENSDDDE